MKSKSPANQLTNPMRRIVSGLFLTHLGYALLGFVLTLALASFFADNSVPEAAELDITRYRQWMSLLTFALYAVSVYNVGWQYGLRDRNVVKCGYAAPNPRRGLIAASLALIPSAGLLIAVWILAPLEVNLRPWFEVFHYTYSWLFTADPTPAWLYALVLPAAPLLVHFGFRNGYKDISLRRKLIYVDPDKKPKKKDKSFR